MIRGITWSGYTYVHSLRVVLDIRKGKVQETEQNIINYFPRDLYFTIYSPPPPPPPLGGGGMNRQTWKLKKIGYVALQNKIKTKNLVLSSMTYIRLIKEGDML